MSENETTYLTMAEAAKRCPGHPHCATVWRWCRKGVRARNGERVRLRHCRVGGRVFTTTEYLTSFFDEVAQADMEHFDAVPVGPAGRSGPGRSPASRERAIGRAEAELAKEGI